MKQHKPFFLSILLLFALLNYSCGTESSINENETIDEVSENYILTSTREVFKSLPSPVETAKLIKQTGVKFDEKILNPARNAPYYETSYSQALNLGVYCADLSYTTFYEQRKITMEYLGAVKLLADGLALSELINKEDLLKIEENIFNKDSIKELVDEVFFGSGEYLNDNSRPEIALLVEVGGWIEGLYLAMQLAKQSTHINKELVDRVAEQRNSLILVIESLENFTTIQPINDVLIDMQKLKTIYDKMISPTDAEHDSNQVLKLTENAKVYVTPEIFMSLYHQINKTRNSYTQ